jgi:hypothetical protein
MYYVVLSMTIVSRTEPDGAAISDSQTFWVHGGSSENQGPDHSPWFVRRRLFAICKNQYFIIVQEWVSNLLIDLRGSRYELNSLLMR